ncbi:MAG TPA: hypothetical protein ENI80_09590 [Acidiferrobacteraceae bacterium]|mgnify:CR=1 FL=1|nr:hypothetical protein [Acidiferrobacteraceae bacterium]
MTHLLLMMQRLAGSLVAIALLSPLVIADSSAPKPEIPKAAGDQCVEDTDYMRRNHMKVILHQRDETMRLGIRTKKHSLKNCINCHATKTEAGKLSVLGEKGFCQSCHTYASVTMDCFSCHSSAPEKDTDLKLGTKRASPHHTGLAYKRASDLSEKERKFLSKAVSMNTGQKQNSKITDNSRSGQ